VTTRVARLFTKAGYKTDRKHVPHSRGLKKADLALKDFRQVFGRSICPSATSSMASMSAPTQRNGVAKNADINGALDAAVKASYLRKTPPKPQRSTCLPIDNAGPKDLRDSRARRPGQAVFVLDACPGYTLCPASTRSRRVAG
jgi:hypothetical protein